MNKTKLGISTNMLAVITFLIAISIEFVSSSYLLSMGFVVLAAYILYKEEDIWLKSCVIKAILIMLVFSLVPFFLSFIDDIIKFINFFLQFAKITINDGFGIMNFIKNTLIIFEKIFLIMSAILALKGKSIKIPVIDNIISKHIQ